MGLLSKIFNTNKLAYILREEEEFSVTAPKQWNVETLTVGDTITPNMFKNQHRYYNFDLYIKEIGYDDDYLDDPESAGYYVITEFGDSVEGNLKYLDNQLTWGLGEINKYLKPKYKVVTTDLNESEDEFNVDAPQNWNIEYLSIGDQITPDMWNQESKLIWDLLDTDINKTYKIIGFFEEWDGYEEQEDFDPIFVELEDEVGHISTESLTVLQGSLKPDFKITQNKNLNEVEDEFNVNAPEDWDIEYLTVGDTITPDMWKQDFIYLSDVYWEIALISNGFHGGVVEIKDKDDYSDRHRFYLDDFNKKLKPEYQVANDLNESTDDEFNIEAPQEWNITELKIGDIITPDMWQDVKYTNSFRLSPWFIKKIENHGENGKLVHVKNDLDSSYWIEISSFNKDYLKPQYQVTDSLSESDDEDFNVNAPEDWNVTELGVGDIITSNMFKTKEDVKFWMNSTNKLQILTIFKEYDEWIVVLGLPNTNERYVSWVIRNANKDLKPQYKIEQNLTESEEDFNVDAPEDWNVIELGVGDQITPDMWQSKQYDLNIQGKTAEITDIGVDDKGPYVVLAHNNPYWSLDYDIDVINDLLKPQYKIEQNLIESDEDFNVDAPAEWDITELKKGDYIMPDMWVKDIDDFFTGQSESKYLFKQLTSKPIKITGVMRGDELYFEVAGLYFILTNDFLLPQYKVVGDFGMYESNEDEFNVDAPSEWDVTELSKGDIITPDMWKDDLINWDHDIKIDGFKPYSNDVGYMVYLKHLDSFLTPQVFDLGEINGWLKNTYRVEVNDLMESDEDDFSVDAPAEWGITYLGVGDTIKGKMWNWKNIIKWCNRVAGDNHVELNELIKRWEDIYDEGVTIDKIVKYGDGYHVEFDSNSAFLRFGPSVSSVNKWLSDGYEIEPSLTESEDDFSVDAPAKWNVTDLEIGDYIYPDMINVPRDKRKWNHYHNMLADPKRTDGWQITGFKKHDGRDLVRLEYNGVGNFFDVNLINSTLKQYRIFLPTNETKLSSLLEIDDEFNVDAPQEWNDDYLTIGDIVTPDMWNDEVRSLKNFKDFNTVLNNSLTIKNIYPQKRGGDPGYLIVFNDHTSVHSSFLDPKYKIDPPLNESDDEFSVDAPLEWNQESLSTGDIITPDMWDKQKFFDDPTMNSIKVYNEAIEDSWIIESINYEEIDNAWFVNLKSSTTDHKYFGLWSEPEELNNINNVLKDNYKIYPPNTLLESDDEEDFSVDAPENWNVTELGIGSILDSSNLKMQDPMKKFEIVDFKVSLFPWGHNEAVLKVFQLKDEPIPGTNRTTRQWKYIRNIFVDIETLNDRLKDNFKITPSLRESEDDFSVEAPSEWNSIDLKKGMVYNEEKGIVWPSLKEVPEELKNIDLSWASAGTYEITGLSPSLITITRVVDRNHSYQFPVDYFNKNYGPLINAYIPTDINENEEDFNVDAPAKWDVTELTIGDTVTSDMFKDLNQAKRSYGSSKKFKIVDIWESTTGSLIVRLKASNWKFSDLLINDDFLLKSFNEDLKDQYKVVLPNELNNLLETDDDEFSVDAPQEWNVTELGVGDIITPDMWKDQSYTYSIQNYTWVINKIENDNDDVNPKIYVNIKNNSNGEFSIELSVLNRDYLKDKYKVVKNKNLTEEEDFSVDAPQEWNVEYLTTGDNITPDMWDQNKIGRRKDFFSKPIKIDSIGYNEFDNEEEEPLVGLDLGDITTEYDIDFVNYLLKPEFKVVQNKNLTEEEDFNVDAPAGWNQHELKVGDYFDDYIGEVYTREEDIPKDSRGFMYEIIYIGPNEGEYHKSAYYNHNIIVFRRVSNKNQTYSFTVEHFNETRGPKLNAYINLPNRFNLNEDEEDFNVDALPEWDVIELKVGDYINSNMLNPKGNDYTWFSRRKLFIEDIYFDECWTVNLLHVESGYHTPFCIDYINEDVLNDKYRIMTSLNELLEIDDEFDVEAPQKWDVIELGVGDKITRDMIKSPGFIHQIGENFQMDFPGVITKIYKSGPIDDDQYWGIRIKFKNKGWKKYLPQSEDVKLGLGLSLDDFNEDVLKPQYQIQKPVFELNTLLENEEDFNVNAPDEWNVELLTVGDTVTPEMWGYEQINSWFDISKPLNIEDIGEDDGGWWVQLGRNEAPFDLDEVNDFLKPQYKIVPYNLEESDDEWSAEAPPEWNIADLEVGGIITPDMWEANDAFKKYTDYLDIPHTIEKIEKMKLKGKKFYLLRFTDGSSEWSYNLKPQYQRVKGEDIFESEENFNVNAPEEWNYDYWEPTKGMRDDEYYKSFDEFVTRILRKYGVEDEFIEVYLDEVFNFGDFTNYEGISSGDLYEDFQQWIKAQDETSEWYDDMNEEEDFNVDAPEEWWEYDGDVELMFQDTYWYEDENGKEAIVERDGGGIVNINDLEQYSYSDWKPFTGNPTSENLTKWYYSINWDTDLVEIFDFDDSLFEVEEDFDWSTAENVDMDRTGFRIRAVSILKEVDDEFTVKAPQKWDIVYLNKGDFLDNTNSTFNDPNVKYEIGNITSDGEIEVKKYINRGSGFEPQFDRFMKTRKGIVKAKLKPGFDIEAFSK